ncbi:YhbP family protein [soil metagenome]
MKPIKPEMAIIKFITDQTCATVCCVDENTDPYCFNCYYAFDAENCLLYFKSSVNSFHWKMLRENDSVAGTILPDKLSKLHVMGVQFKGIVLDKDDDFANKAFATYHKKMPFALAMQGEVITIEITDIKMTDNKLGFGKKLLWKREVVLHKHVNLKVF